jgi:hypothetical protein
MGKFCKINSVPCFVCRLGRHPKNYIWGFYNSFNLFQLFPEPEETTLIRCFPNSSTATLARPACLLPQGACVRFRSTFSIGKLRITMAILHLPNDLFNFLVSIAWVIMIQWTNERSFRHNICTFSVQPIHFLKCFNNLDGGNKRCSYKEISSLEAKLATAAKRCLECHFKILIFCMNRKKSVLFY